MTEKVHWTELQYVTNKPNLRMLLTDDGIECVIYLKCLLKKEPRGLGGTYRDVIFDRSYVIYWLNNFYKGFYNSVNIKPFKELASLMIVSLLKHCKVKLKVYNLHGKEVIRLEDLGLTYGDIANIDKDDKTWT